MKLKVRANQLIKKAKIRGWKALPTALTIAGGVGVIVTAALTARATLKIKQHREDLKDLPIQDQALRIVPEVIPPVVAGVLTVGCILGANTVNTKQKASLASLYSLGGAQYSRLMNGLNDQSVADKETTTPKDQKILFYDEISNRRFSRTMEEILDAEYHLNRKFITKEYATLNDWYELIGLPAIPEGDFCGWSIGAGVELDHYLWIDIEHELCMIDDGPENDGLECLILKFVHQPSESYLDY